jgi:hypothetical protein
MDLAKELIIWGIGMDWSDIDDIKNRPIYMRRQDYLPCDCKVCFFCLNALTHGIDHKKKGRGKKAKRRSRSDRPECPIKRATQTTRRCIVCHKNQLALNPTFHFSEVEKLCKQTRLGCTSCEANVCGGCWDDYEH